MDQKTARKTNPVLQDEIAACEEAARRNDAAVWRRVADELRAATRSQRTVNLSHLDRHTEDGDVVVVPGKVLGSGTLDTDITVAAHQFTRSARDAIDEAGDAVYIDELVDERPDGADVQVIG